MICNQCKKDKDIDSFYPSDRYKCRDCKREIDRKRYQDPERKLYLKGKFMEWYSKPENQKKHSINGTKYSKIWQSKNRIKRNAEQKVARAVKKGIIVNPGVCSKCVMAGRIEAHHPDYSKPLEVIWLCRECHKRLHLSTKKHF